MNSRITLKKWDQEEKDQDFRRVEHWTSAHKSKRNCQKADLLEFILNS